MPKPLRVGLIGASQKRGWAKISHVPALQNLAGIELDAVTARDPAAAVALATAVGARRGFADVESMIVDSDVDVVAVSVRVPSHRELVLRALAGGSTSTANGLWGDRLRKPWKCATPPRRPASMR